MRDFDGQEIPFDQYPTATDLSLLAIELSKKSDPSEEFIHEKVIQNALTLWEDSHNALQQRMRARKYVSDILNKKLGEVPEWPQPEKTHISYEEFQKTIAKGVDQDVFGQAIVCFYFFLINCIEWFEKNVFGFETIGFTFSTDKGKVKYSDLDTLVEGNNIPAPLVPFYSFYLHVEAQHREIGYLTEDPLTIDTSSFSEANYQAAKREVNHLSRDGINKDNHREFFVSVFYCVRFYANMYKYLSASSRRAGKTQKK